LWNSLSVNEVRNNLIIKKNFDNCFKCHKFYEENFLIVEGGQLNYKGGSFIFDSEINYVKSCPKLAVVKTKQINTNYMVDVRSLYSDEELIELNKTEKILLLIE